MAFFVAIASGDVHHRGKPTTIFGTETTTIDVGIKDDIGLEYGVETNRVEWVIDNHAVEKAEVLNHGATADIELSALVASGVDSRKYL